MERYTRREGEEWLVPIGLEQAALARLACFEDAYQALCIKKVCLEEQMAPRRAPVKQKRARFRELLGEKLMLQQLFVWLESHGIK